MSTFASQNKSKQNMKLNDIAEFVTDKICSGSISLENYVTTDSLLQNKRGRETAQNLPPMQCALTHYKRGDVLVANIRPYLKKVWFADSEGGCSSDVLVFRAKIGHYPSFLYAVLIQDAFFDYTMSGAKGSKMPRGDKDQIMRYELPTFTSLEEENIGNMMVDIMSKINVNRQINDNLEEQLRLITSHYIICSPNLEKKRIGEIAMVKAGGDCPITFSKTRTQECNIPIFSNGTEDRGLYGFTDKATIEEHSITVAARGTIGYSERRLKPFVPIIRLLAITPKDEGAYIYLHQVIKGMKFKKNGSVQQQLTVPEISFIEIPYPHSSVLSEYNKVASPIVEMIEHNISENELLTKLRDELLPLLMNGQASVNYHLSVLFITKIMLYYKVTNINFGYERNNNTKRFRWNESGSVC